MIHSVRQKLTNSGESQQMSTEGVTQCSHVRCGRAVYLSGKRTGLKCRCSTLWRADSKSALIFVQSSAFAEQVVPDVLTVQAYNITMNGKEREKSCWNL